ncbi:MAG: hypothetical protein R2824_15185 [Saprospiraceae bacterium]
MFPTIVSSRINLRFRDPLSDVLPYSIFNLAGQIVQQGTLNTSTLEQDIPLGQYPGGMDMIRIDFPMGSKTLKFIRQ